MPLDTWITLFAACWLISVSPGPSAVATVHAAIDNGVRRTYWLILGVILGIASLLTIVAVGLGAVLAASELAFQVVKWAGVAYLVYLGIQAFRSGDAGGLGDDTAGPPATAWALFGRGYLVSVTNPKGIIFLVAMVPQFIDPALPLLAQYLVFGITFAFTDLIVMGGYALLSSRAIGAFALPSVRRWTNRSTGGVFVGLAAWVALTAKRT